MGRSARTYAAAAVTALVAVLVWDRFGRVLALDVEALIENLVRDWTTDYAQAPYARTDFVAPFRIAVRFGPMPLIAVVVAGWMFRLTAGEEGDHPLSRLTGRAKALVALATLGPFGLAAFPLGLGLSMWVAVELYWWLEWYGDIDPTMIWLHENLPWVLLPGVALAGVAGLVYALSESPDPVVKKRRRRSLRWRTGRWLAAAPISVVLLAGLFGVSHASRVSSTPGMAVHASECGRCHERSLPLYYVKSPDAWRRTVDTHVDIERVDLTEPERAALIGFLTSMRSFSDHWTFRTRCQGCHGSTWREWEPRTAEDWQGVVARSPYYYRADVADQIGRFLASQGLVGGAGGLLDLRPERAEEVRDVVRYCGFCHSVSYEADRYLEHAAADDGELERMVERMNDKIHLGLRMDEATMRDVTRSYVELIGDDRFDRLVPHDRPELGTGRLPGDKIRLPTPKRY